MGHFYDDFGNPVHEVPKKTEPGKTRPTNIVDARKLNLNPGTTDIIGMAAKEGLTKWQITKALEAGWHFKHLPVDSEKDWMRKVKEHSELVTVSARIRGKELHRKLEDALRNGVVGPEDYDFVCPVIDTLERLYPGVIFTPERTFAHPLGFGGSVDISAPGYIGDYKCKDSGDITSQSEFDEWCQYKIKQVYDSLRMQLAAYRMGLNMPTAKCFNIIISSRKEKLHYHHSWHEDEIAEGWEMFKLLHKYWQFVNKYHKKVRDVFCLCGCFKTTKTRAK